MAGAFDLSSLKKSEPTQAPGVPGTPGAQAGTAQPQKVPGPYVVAVDARSLQGIMQTSLQVPVIIAFHSEQSPNSGTLVAQLETLAVEKAGQFQLGKVDVDASSDVAGAFGINAVPAAAALLQGNPIPLFQGLPEETQVRDSVDKVIQAAGEYGITGVVDGDEDATIPEPEIPPLHKEGLAALEQGDLAGAHAAYTKALGENPADSEAKVALAQVELLQRVQALNPSATPQGAQEVVERANTAELTDVDTQLMGADLEMAYNRPDAAVSRLIDVIKVTKDDERESVRKRILDYFEILGPTTDFVVEARKKLTNALF